MNAISSLRGQLLLPMLLGSSVVALFIAVISYATARSQADQENYDRFQSLSNVVAATNFPLTNNVLQLLAGLTDAAWFTLDSEGRVVHFASPHRSVIEFEKTPDSAGVFSQLRFRDQPTRPMAVELNGRSYQAICLPNLGQRDSNLDKQVAELIVMVDQSRRNQAIMRATVPPILTGLSTILLLGSLSWLLAERLIHRIGKLQQGVDRIAQGDFGFSLPNKSRDEFDKLASAINMMAERLGQMWRVLRQTQSQQLMHQIAGGLAHNLRNTLTGARLAIELVDRQQGTPRSIEPDRCVDKPNDSGLMVAVEQLKQAEDYIQRLLWMAKGRTEELQPAVIRDCLLGLQTGLESTARHRAISMNWQIDPSLENHRVADGPGLMSGVSNLVWNAMEAGKRVKVSIELSNDGRNCQIEVSDNGAGPSPEIEPSMFEPFASSKSEGMGLGLPLIKQAAETLSGEITWLRKDEWTIFRFSFPVL